jgi:hypothetical protein
MTSKDHRYLASMLVYENETDVRQFAREAELTPADLATIRQILAAHVEAIDTAINQINAARRERQLMRRGPTRPRSNQVLDKCAKGEQK